MRLAVYSDPEEFLARTQTELERNEVANSLMLGIALALRRDLFQYGSQPYLATVENDERLVAAGLMTPPHKLQIIIFFSADTLDGDAALEQLADDLLAGGWLAPGVIAAEPYAGRFAALWTRHTGRSHRLAMQLRVHELRQVNPTLQLAQGELRPATPADAGLIIDWARAFEQEASNKEQDERARQRVLERIGNGDIYLWVDGQPVAMAARVRAIGNGGAVSMVYTPPAVRGRGYATACVARLSQRLLDGGWQYCSLYTNLDNPTSNWIYRQIGYLPVADSMEYEFEPTGDD